MRRFLILGIFLLAIIILPKFVGDNVAGISGVLVNAETSWRMPKDDFAGDGKPKAAVVTNDQNALTGKLADTETFFCQAQYRMRCVMWPAQHFFQVHRMLFLCLNLAFFLLMLCSISIAVALQRFSLARKLGERGFRAGANEVLLICIVTILAHMGGMNFFAGVHYLIWLVPVICVIFLAGLLRMIDMNHPVWNETLRSVCLPVLSSLLVLEWNRVYAVLNHISF